MKEHRKNLLYAIILLVVSILLSLILYAAYEQLHVPVSYRVEIDLVLLIVFGAFIIEFLGKAATLYSAEEISPGEARTLGNILRLVGYAILAIIILDALGINVTGLLIGAGFLGIVIGLAAQPTLSNMFSGIAIMLSKPFDVGDKVTILTWQYGAQPPSYPHEEFVPGFSGTIESVGIIYTKMNGEDGLPTYVPNSILNQAMIINHHRSERRLIRIRLNVDKKIKFDELKLMLIKGLKNVKGIELTDISADISLITKTGYHVILKFWATHKNEEEARSRALNEAISILSRLAKKTEK